jgi:hypothetical protein
VIEPQAGRELVAGHDFSPSFLLLEPESAS